MGCKRQCAHPSSTHASASAIVVSNFRSVSNCCRRACILTAVLAGPRMLRP